MSPNPNPEAGLDFESEGTTTPPAGGALLDETVRNTPAAPDADVETVDFDDSEIYRRPGELAVCGEKTPDIRHRFSVLPSPTNPEKAFLVRAWTHATDKGHAKCHSKRNAKGEYLNAKGEVDANAAAFCCKGTVGMESEAKPRMCALVVEYTCTDRATGGFPKGIGGPGLPFTFEIKALPLSQFAAKQLNNKAGETDEGKALKVHEVDYWYGAEKGKKGLIFEKLSKASWSRNAVIKAQVEEAAKPYADSKALSMRVGRKLTVNQMKEHLGLGGSAAAGGSEEAFQDL